MESGSLMHCEPVLSAISMKHQQKEIRDSEIQLERHKTETDRLQARLIEAEKVLVNTE